MDDLRERIADTRPTPGDVAPIDAERLVVRGRRQRRLGQAATGVAGVLVVVLAVVGLGAGDRPSGPEIADERDPRRVDAPIGVLDRPARPDDALPDAVRTQLELDEAAADTARLARRTPGQRWYVYLDEAPQGSPAGGEQVCLLGFASSDPSGTFTTGCTSRRVPEPATARVAFVTRSSDLGTAGIVTDGAASVGEATGGLGSPDEVPADLPVVNNVFVAPAASEDDAEGRGPEAFCAAAPAPDAGPQYDTPGGDEHLALLEMMATRAPLAIAADVHLVWDHVRGNVSPDDPVSQSSDAFPAPVREAVDRVDAWIGANCGPAADTGAAGSVAWDGAATGSARLTEVLRAEWDPRGSFVRVRVASPDGVTLDLRGQVVDGRLDPATRTINFLPVGEQSFHANEVGPFATEPPGTCTVVFDTLALGVVDGEIDCTLTTPEGDAAIDLAGTFTTQ